MGVNFNLFSNSLISLSFNFLEEQFTICILLLFANRVYLVGCLGTKIIRLWSSVIVIGHFLSWWFLFGGLF